MGFFGSKKTSTTTVAPDKAVAKNLQSITSSIQNMPQHEYINHVLANYTPEQIQAMHDYAESQGLMQNANALQGRFDSGLTGIQDQAERYKTLAGQNITGADINAGTQAQMAPGSLYQHALNQGTSALSAGVRLNQTGSGASRAAARRNAGQIGALSNLSQGINYQGQNIDRLTGNRAAQMDITGRLGNIATTNANLGIQAELTPQQIIGRKLQVAQAQQGMQNQQNQNDWMNAMGAQQQSWNNLQNKQQALSGITNMAGYTTTGSGPAPSKLGQVMGVAAQVGGMALQGVSNYKTNMAGYENAGGPSNIQGPMPGNSPYDNLSQGSQYQAPSFWQAVQNPNKQAAQAPGFGASSYSGF